MRLLTVVCFCALWTAPVRALEIDLVRTNVTMPTGRTFQMPLTASDTGGGPLTFSIVSISPKKLTGAITPSSNRSLVLNVSGIDSTTAPFTGDLVLQLYEDLVTNATARIIELVNSGFYNGLTFHRVVKDFVCQGGDPNGDGTGGTGVKFDDEFVATLTFTGFGQLAMANSGDDSNDSQFFITDEDLSVDNPNKLSPRWLDFQHTIFGQMTRGFDLLGKLMGTPVGTNSVPIDPVIINSATIITNMQDAVLRLSALPDFTGDVAVTVAVMNASQQTAQQTFHVNIVPNIVNDPPFLGPIPSNLIITQGQAASFTLTTVTLDGDRSHFLLTDADTGMFPTNFDSTIDSASRVWLVPDLTLTGTVNLVVWVTDNQPGHDFDSQHFSVTILPAPAAPTLTIAPKSGTITVSINSHASRIKITGTFAFTSQSDHAFANEDIILMTVGDQTNPFVVTIAPNNVGHTWKNGVITLKPVLSSSVAGSAQFNSVKGTFKISLSNFDFPGPQANPIQIGLTIGNDHGTDVRTWVEKKPGVFAPPKAP